MSNRYRIKGYYRSRDTYHHFDDSDFEDEWQLEVYLHALGLLRKHDLNSVIDIGCGSGYKLATYFQGYKTLGLELPENIDHLRKKYPKLDWDVCDLETPPDTDTDILICSDVIEHLVDPDAMLNYIKRFAFRYLVISTPDRRLMYKPWEKGYFGPPTNKAHTREWKFWEFRNYLSEHFNVIDHRVTNLEQCTQMAICQRKI